MVEVLYSENVREPTQESFSSKMGSCRPAAAQMNLFEDVYYATFALILWKFVRTSSVFVGVDNWYFAECLWMAATLQSISSQRDNLICKNPLIDHIRLQSFFTQTSKIF